VVPCHKVLGAVEPAEDGAHTLELAPNREIAEVPDDVALRYDLVPPAIMASSISSTDEKGRLHIPMMLSWP
jgi:hypothetical protein